MVSVTRTDKSFVEATLEWFLPFAFAMLFASGAAIILGTVWSVATVVPVVVAALVGGILDVEVQ